MQYFGKSGTCVHKQRAAGILAGNRHHAEGAQHGAHGGGGGKRPQPHRQAAPHVRGVVRVLAAPWRRHPCGSGRGCGDGQ